MAAAAAAMAACMCACGGGHWIGSGFDVDAAALPERACAGGEKRRRPENSSIQFPHPEDKQAHATAPSVHSMAGPAPCPPSLGHSIWAYIRAKRNLSHVRTLARRPLPPACIEAAPARAARDAILGGTICSWCWDFDVGRSPSKQQNTPGREDPCASYFIKRRLSSVITGFDHRSNRRHRGRSNHIPRLDIPSICFCIGLSD